MASKLWRKKSETSAHWDFYVDKLIAAVWKGNHDHASKAFLPLQKGLQQATNQKEPDTKLFDALNRLAIFYCLEQRLEDCQDLLTAIQNVEKETDLPAITSEQFQKIGNHLQLISKQKERTLLNQTLTKLYCGQSAQE